MKVSIVIRTKNEARWLGPCLRALEKQTYKNFQIVVVDNNSSDASKAIAKAFGAKTVDYKTSSYKPGQALNLGVREVLADAYVFLSAHCIPVSTTWLQEFVEDLAIDPKFAGVYGRQIPVSYSSDEDKRDLVITFGLDSHVKTKDPFFHNANSIIRHDALYPDLFNEQVSNIEDRVWAKGALDIGWKTYYSARSEVRHFHGIHQRGKEGSRSSGTADILNQIESSGLREMPKTIYFILCIKEHTSSTSLINRIGITRVFRQLIELTKDVKQMVKLVICHPQNMALADLQSETNGLNVSFVEREEWMQENWVSIPEILATYLQKEDFCSADKCIYMDHKYIFRDGRDVECLVRQAALADSEFDTAIYQQSVNGLHFTAKDFESHEIAAEIFMPRTVRSQEGIASQKVLQGYGSMFRCSDLVDGSVVGGKIKWLEPSSHIACIRVEDELEYDEIFSAKYAVW